MLPGCWGPNGGNVPALQEVTQFWAFLLERALVVWMQCWPSRPLQGVARVPLVTGDALLTP